MEISGTFRGRLQETTLAWIVWTLEHFVHYIWFIEADENDDIKFRCTPKDQTHAASLFPTGSTHVHTAIKSKQRDSLFVSKEKSSINSPDLSFHYAALILFTIFSDLCASKTTMKDISTRRLHSLIHPQNKHFTNNCLDFFPPS